MPPPNPDWVKALKPSGPQGSELLEQERAKSAVNVDQLADFLFTKEVLERNAKILSILESDPIFDKSQNYFRGRKDRIEAALARGKALQRLSVKHNWSQDEYQAANDLISEPTPYGLHASMFLKTLEEQGTPAQHKLFLEPAQRYEYIGCYAQTELGHGSNVRGLETTATWNPEDKTFTIHSPHLTASKWWIGSLGKAANHAVVVAQLILNGKTYGPHPFVVPIRDLKTHEPLENIHVGDIGPKFGYNTMDNGFLLFNHVRIPHINMLSRFSGVDPETSKYIRPANPALVYGTLTFVRSSIVLQSGSVLARGVTIATRYCAVRRQFQDRDAAADEVGENQVLNYTMVQQRLLPLLAASYALHFTGRAMIKLYEANQKRMAQKLGAGDNAGRAPGPEELNPDFGQLFAKDPMKHVKAYLGSKESVKGVHVFIGVFLETLFSPYFGIYDSSTHTFSHWGEPGVLFETTSYGNAAEFTAQVVLDKEAVGIQRFVGDIKSMDDITLAYERVYGVKTTVVVKGSAKQLYDKMWSVRNQPSSQPHEYMAMFYQYYMVNEQTYVGPYLHNLKYPDVKALTIEEFMRRVPLDQLPAVYRNLVTERL